MLYIMIYTIFSIILTAHWIGNEFIYDIKNDKNKKACLLAFILVLPLTPLIFICQSIIKVSNKI